MKVYARDFPTGAPFGERMKAWKAVRQEVNEAFPDDETPVSVATCQKCVRDTIKEMSPSFGQFAKGKLTGSSRLTTDMEKVVYDAWYQEKMYQEGNADEKKKMQKEKELKAQSQKKLRQNVYRNWSRKRSNIASSSKQKQQDDRWVEVEVEREMPETTPESVTYTLDNQESGDEEIHLDQQQRYSSVSAEPTDSLEQEYVVNKQSKYQEDTTKLLT